MTQPLKIYIGWDARQPISYHVLAHSIVARSSVPVSITPLNISQLPITRTGLTPFTFSRFLVPWLQRWKGGALFLDADMLCLGDIAELFECLGSHDAVAVCKSLPPFEWASAILFECSHFANRQLVPSYIEGMPKGHKIGWVPDEQIGEIPPEWNHVVLYSEPRDDAKLVHYTGGVPGLAECAHHEYADEWRAERDALLGLQSWSDLMGRSVHAPKVKAAWEAQHGEGTWLHDQEDAA